MAQLYQLIPLPQGIFAKLSLIDRALFGLVYDRMKLSVNNHLSSTDGLSFYDVDEEEVYCVYSQTELALTLGVSERTVRRSVSSLVDGGFLRTKKVRYQDANRYFIPFYIRQELKPQQSGQIVPPMRPI